MLRFSVVFLVFLFTGCGQSVYKDDLHLLNGYWEIAEVEFENGEKKEYALASSIDFFFLEGTKGYRKKVQPNVLGGFYASDNAQNFEIKEVDDDFVIWYQNSLDDWSVRLLELSKNTFSVVNEENNVYRYKRHQPINLTE